MSPCNLLALLLADGFGGAVAPGVADRADESPGVRTSRRYASVAEALWRTFRWLVSGQHRSDAWSGRLLCR
jgi:hypothetical protein